MTATELITFSQDDQAVFDALNMVQSGVTDPEQWLIDALGGGTTSASGQKVTPYRALGLPAVWNSVNLLAGHIGAMPFEIRRSLATGGSDNLPNSKAYRVLNRETHELYTPFVFRQTLMTHALLQGNGRAAIIRNGMGDPESLLMMYPENTWTWAVEGQKFHTTWFNTQPENGTLEPGQLAEYSSSVGLANYGNYTIPDRDVLHIPGLGFNGLWGIPLVAVAKDTFGTDLAGIESMGFNFRNNSRPGLLLTDTKNILSTEKAAKEFMTFFRNNHEGSSNRGRIGLLRSGMEAMVLPPVQADEGLSQLREYSEHDLALLMGTEYLLGSTSGQYKDLSERMSAYVTNTLNKWMETWECEVNRKLIRPNQFTSGRVWSKLNAKVLLRGSPNTLADYTGKLRTQALISGDEGREMHGLNPAGLDDYGNPNTSSGDEEEQTTEDEPEQEEQDEAENAAKFDPLAYNFRSLIEHEARRVIQTTRTKDFATNLQRFYKTHEAKMRLTCEDLGLDPQLAEDHCSDSQDWIIEVAGCVPKDALESQVTELVSDWVNRSENFSNQNR